MHRTSGACDWGVRDMLTLILIVVLVLLLFGGGGLFYGRR